MDTVTTKTETNEALDERQLNAWIERHADTPVDRRTRPGTWVLDCYLEADHAEALAMNAVESRAAELRQIAGGDDSYGSFLHVEVSAMDKVEFAADPQGDSDAERLAEIRSIIAALRLVRAERRGRLGR